MSDLESRINSLSPAKRALLERRLREKVERLETEPIRPRSSAGRPPLSFGQQRLWFLDQWDPGNPAYKTSRVISIEGLLDLAALERSLTEIMRRHETLRTTFAADGDAPVQVIHPPEPMTVQRVDLTTFSSGQKEAEVLRQMSEEASHPFDLARGPLFHATLLQLEPQKHLLLLSIHHIATDGWSMGVLHRELFTLYEAFAKGEPSPLSELPIQYGDFSVWQRRRLQGEFLTNQLNYWREQLRDLPTLELPTDHPRPPTQTFNGATYQIHLPKSLVEGLKSLSRQEGATLFMTLLAAFQTLLHRYSGQDDVVVGSPIAGRSRVETEELIGFFVNMLVLRANASGDPSFREFLRQVVGVAHGAYAHQDIPFEKLVEELHPRRDPSRNPLFQVMFALQNVPRPSPPLSVLKVARVNPAQSTIRFDLEVHVQETEDGLSGLFVYNTVLFEAETIERMTGHFRRLLEAIVARAEQPLSELSLLGEGERNQLLEEWNQTGTEYPRNSCIHEIFEAQAQATPDALAVAFGKHEMTYRQLNERANQLAYCLRALDVGPDVLVGVCIERSIEMIIGFLGILKAGGAYVPLDPSHPRERLAFMLEDAKAPVLLTQSKMRPNLPETQAHVVCMDKLESNDRSRENPRTSATATNLAYVIYTSGSTGKPKGVPVPHRAVVRLVLNTNYVQLRPDDRIAQGCNASFDVAMFEIWGALLNGASLIGIPQSVLLSPRDFARKIHDEKINTLFLTPALFNEMASEVPIAFRQLRYLLIGGDVCNPKWVRRILEHGAPQNVLNAYGPTESTGFATWHRVESVRDGAATVPIGRPISNTSVYVLDRHLQPVPIGVIGELYIGGDGLARGYLNRPELTSEKFIRHPFNNDPSARLYKTGDFVRYLSDGSIDFIGRIDKQVKIRGFRIELQEIEAVLSQHPGVSKSVIIARQTDRVEKRILAYFVPNDARLSSEALRRFLREKLPDYMIPAAFVALDSLPLTPNGKLDHAALPEPELDRNESGGGRAEPRTLLEEGIARIWRELLGIISVSIYDNFFDLGGHSLLAIQVIARIEKRFGKNLSVAVLFQAPTIGQLANILNEETLPQHWSSLIPVQPEGTRLPFFWIHGDSTNIILPAYLGPDQPLYGLEHQGHDGRPARYTQVETIAKHYLEELRTVRPRGPYLLGGYSFGAVIAFDMAQQLRKEGEHVALTFMLDPPGVEKEKSSIPIQTEIQRHLQELAPLGTGEKLHYVLRRVSDRFGARTAWIRKGLEKLRWNWYLSQGRLLPVSLRGPYILDIYGHAKQAYVPRQYPGRVMIFKARPGSYMTQFDWVKLITGELEIHERSGDHMDLRKEPHVRHWAVLLKKSLDRAQCELKQRKRE